MRTFLYSDNLSALSSKKASKVVKYPIICPVYIYNCQVSSGSSVRRPTDDCLFIRHKLQTCAS